MKRPALLCLGSLALCLTTLLVSPNALADSHDLRAAVDIPTPSLASIKRFDVQPFTQPFTPEPYRVNAELSENVRQALAQKHAFPLGSPADGLITLGCADNHCKHITVKITARSSQTLIWEKSFPAYKRFFANAFWSVSQAQTTLAQKIAAEIAAARGL